MAYTWGVILTTYDTWEPILQVVLWLKGLKNPEPYLEDHRT